MRRSCATPLSGEVPAGVSTAGTRAGCPMQPDVLTTGEHGDATGRRLEARKALLTSLIRDRAWRGTPAESWVPRCAEKLGADELDERGVDWAIHHLKALPFS